MSPDQGLNYRHFSSRAQRIITFLRENDSPVCSMLRELCFTLAMIDDSAMHVALALTLLFAKERRKYLLQEFDSSLEHYNASVSLVNQQITSIGNSACDALIGVVSTLACYDLCTSNLDRWVIHMAGLGRLVEIRGGIDKIGSRYLKMTLPWTNLTGSMMADTFPYFEPPKVQLQRQDISPTLSTVTGTLQKRLPGHSNLCTVLESMSDFTTTARGKSQWTTDPIMNQELQSVVFMMLSLPRHDALDAQDDGDALHEAIRLALLLFISGPSVTLAGNKDGNRIISYHHGRLPMLLRSHHLDWAGLEDLELWVLVIAALVEIGDDQEWVLGQINHKMLVRDLNWDSILGVLAQISWIDGLWTRTLDQLRDELEETFGPLS
ncbi:hypothetical protein ACHAPT_005284 [Fusarium lateritium]